MSIALDDPRIPEPLRALVEETRAQGTPRTPLPYLIAFDAETNGLHGPVFAIGGVVLDPAGEEVPGSAFFARTAGPARPVDFVAREVLPALAATAVTHQTDRSLRDAFWGWLRDAMDAPGRTSLVVVDCGWPVEAGLLAACVADEPAREMTGPYPLHDVATLLYGAGFDPLRSYARRVLPDEPPQTHHPLWDARVSARVARMALQRLRTAGLPTPP